MEIKFKRLTQLGLGAALATGALAACGAPASKETTDQPEATVVDVSQDPAPVEAHTGEGEGEGEAGAGEGEGGEGEGGVAIEQALTDPVVYNAALAITEAHIIAARDAFAMGEADAAGEMFAHPVSEVVFDMQPIFEARGVADFSNMLTDASRAVFAGEGETEINAHAANIIATLRVAEAKAPDDGSSAAQIAAGVVADQVERASDMYRAAAESGAYEPYLDGYGFYKAGEGVFLRAEDQIEAENPDAAAAIRIALQLLDVAYPNAGAQETLGADQALLAASASNVILAVGG